MVQSVNMTYRLRISIFQRCKLKLGLLFKQTRLMECLPFFLYVQWNWNNQGKKGWWRRNIGYCIFLLRSASNHSVQKLKIYIENKFWLSKKSSKFNSKVLKYLQQILSKFWIKNQNLVKILHGFFPANTFIWSRHLSDTWK